MSACALPLPGNDSHDDAPPPELHVAVPCELVGRIDASQVAVGEGVVTLVCDPSQYPPEVRGRSVVLDYVDYVDDAGGHGLRQQVLAALDEGGSADELVTFRLFCDGTIEVGGWGERPGDGFDLERIRVAC